MDVVVVMLLVYVVMSLIFNFCVCLEWFYIILFGIVDYCDVLVLVDGDVIIWWFGLYDELFFFVFGVFCYYKGLYMLVEVVLCIGVCIVIVGFGFECENLVVFV